MFARRLIYDVMLKKSLLVGDVAQNQELIRDDIMLGLVCLAIIQNESSFKDSDKKYANNVSKKIINEAAALKLDGFSGESNHVIHTPLRFRDSKELISMTTKRIQEITDSFLIR